MGEKLVAKHTNSLPVKKSKLLRKESESRDCCSHSRPCRLTIFCILTCCIFLIYWIILTPLLLNTFTEHYSKNAYKWSASFFVLYWLIAFLVWLFIMLCLILIWRCSNVKHADNEKLQSYGTNGIPMSGLLISPKLDHTQILKIRDTKRDGSWNDSVYDVSNTVHHKANISDESQYNKIKKHKDLPPLVIHRRSSGNDVERAGTILVEETTDKKDVEKGDLKSGSDTERRERESMKEYLKLVTVTPQDDLDISSVKGPLSPREIFFIDLIKEAEKAEQSKTIDSKGTDGKHFFPTDISSTKEDIDKVLSEKKDAPTPAKHAEQEATYFIANIESPRSEKAEVFLEIDPDPKTVKEWSMNLSDEKPVLTIQESAKDEGNEDINEKVVLFEV